MDKVSGRLTVFFEELFWVGVFERVIKEAGHNPKRVQREVRKQVQNSGIGTKSQQALKLQQEQLKTERKAVSREQREAEKERKFELKQHKRKEMHRGR